MNNYKYLVWAGTATLTILSVFLLVNIQRIAGTATTTNTISFNGEGKVFAVPDVAVLSFSIVTEAATSKAAQDTNSVKSKQVVDFLKGQSIDEKDIKTSGYNVYPQYSYPQPVPMGTSTAPMPAYYDRAYPEYYPSSPKITGYQVNQSFEVKVRDLEKVSTVLDGLVAAGANQVNNLGFRIDDEEKLKETARNLAIEDAKMKAGSLQKQLKVRLGKIVNYQEGGYYPPMYFKSEAMDVGGRGGGGPLPEIPVGENEVVVNVTITYQIK